MGKGIVGGNVRYLSVIVWRFAKKAISLHPKIADMAQLVEQRIRNAWVPGSSPGIGSVLMSRLGAA